MIINVLKKNWVILILGLILVSLIAIAVVYFLNLDDKNLNNTDELGSINLTEAGVYDDLEGYESITIDSDGVTLKNAEVTNIVISEKVGDGTVYLESVTADNIDVLGGGENSVYFKESSTYRLNIDYSNVRVLVDENSEVEIIDAKKMKKLIIDGTVDELNDTSTSSLEINENAVLNSLNLNSKSSVKIFSKVMKINISDQIDELEIFVDEKGAVESLSSRTKITLNGTGIVSKVIIPNRNNIFGDIKPLEVTSNYTVTFDTDGGSAVDSVQTSDLVTMPENPSKDGYEFLYWVLDSEVFDFDLKVTEDITLVATWKKLGSTEVNGLLGDVNKDGVLNYIDVDTLRKYVAGGYGITFDSEAKKLADMNNDSRINATDIILLRRETLAVGDVNKDGAVNFIDVDVMRKYIAGGYGITFDEEAILLADMNNDSRINATDIILLRRETLTVGDVNKDGAVNYIDVDVMRKYIAGGYGITFDAEAMLLADMNNDSRINMTDVILLRRETLSVGDVNKDGAVNFIDVDIMRKYIAGGYGITFDAEAMLLADMDNDSVINMTDVILLRRETLSVGDVNKDGVVNYVDVDTLRKYIVGGYGITFDAEAILLADMDNDSRINMTDVILLNRETLNIGDVNKDGAVNYIDVDMLKKYVAGGTDITFDVEAILLADMNTDSVLNQADIDLLSQQTLKLGDVNKDGVLDQLDVDMIRQYIVGGYGITFDAEAVLLADMNGDSRINTTDTILLRREIGI